MKNNKKLGNKTKTIKKGDKTFLQAVVTSTGVYVLSKLLGNELLPVAEKLVDLVKHIF